MQVVEHQQEGFVGGGGRQPAGHAVEEPVPLRLRIGSERSGQTRHPLGHLGYQSGQFAAVATQAVRQPVAVVHEVAQRFDERLVRDAEILIAAPGQHHGAFVMGPPGQFGGQAGLTHPRLAGKEGDPQLARRRFLPQLPEPLELGVPADEDTADVGQERRQGDGGLSGQLPVDLDRRHRLGKPFQLQAPNSGEGDLTRTGERAHGVRSQDLPALRLAAEPSCLDDRSAEAVLAFENDVPGADSDTHVQRRRARPIVPPHRLLDGDRRLYGVRRSGEGGHDPVAQVLDEAAALGVDRVGHQPVVLVP